jgi:hypothetical protein
VAHGTQIVEPYARLTVENGTLLELAIRAHSCGWSSDEKLETLWHKVFVSCRRLRRLSLVLT